MTPTASSGLARAGRAVVGLCGRRPLAVLLAALLVTAATLWAVASGLGIDTSTEDMISPEVPFRQHDIAFARAFPQLRGLLVAVVDAETPEQADSAAAALVERMRDHPELFNQVFWPAGLPYLRQNGLLFLSEPELQALADRLAEAAPLLGSLAADPSLRGLAEVLALAFGEQADARPVELAPVLLRLAEVAEAQAAGRPDRLSWRSLVTGDTTAQLGGDSRQFVLAQPVRDFGGLKPAAPAIAFLREQAQQMTAEGTIERLRLTGSPALDQEELDSVALGGKTAGILSLLGVTLLLFVGLRSPKIVAAATATLLVGLIWTAGFALLLVGYLNLLSVAFAVVFIGLGIDFGIHFCLRYLEEAERQGERPETRRGALAATGAGIAGALTLSAVAAAAGFLSFLPTDYRGLAQLGLISGAGMGCALVASFTVLPATLALLKPRGRLPRNRRLGGGANRAIARRARAVCLVAALLAVGCAALLPSLRFDFNPINLKDPRAESVATFQELAAEPNNSVYTLDLLRPDLAAASETAETLRALPETGRVLTLQSFVPENQEPKLAVVDAMASYLGPVFFSLPEAPPSEAERAAALARIQATLQQAAAGGDTLAEVAARLRSALAALAGPEALAAYERRVFAGFPGLIDQLSTALEARQVGLEDIPEALRSQWMTESGGARVQVFSAERILDNDDLARFADAVRAVAPDATGTPIVVTEASRTVVAAFIEATLIALAAIVAILMIVLRRLDDTLLVLAPLLLAALLTAAASVLFGLAFNFANVIVLPLLLGLGVSAGIHLVLRRREQGPQSAVMESSTPRAVLFSALTTLASFGSLALSGHRGMTSMGQLLTVSILALLFATLVVLPALMAWLRPPPSAPGQGESLP